MELIKIEQVNAMELFTKEKGLDPILEKIKEEVANFKADISTISGRKEIARMAHKVSRSKTYIDNVGKGLVAELKLKPKLIDNERKRIRGVLDQLKVSVREPLSKWEDAEVGRVQNHKDNLMRFHSYKLSISTNTDSDLILRMIKNVSDTVIDESWEEFKPEAIVIHRTTLEFLNEKYEQRIVYEKEQEELKKLREEKAVSDRIKREEEIRVRAERETQERVDRLAKKEKESARIKEEELVNAKNRAELEKRELIIRAAKEKEASEKRLEEAKQRAIEIERSRTAREQEQKRIAQGKLDNDAKNRKDVHQQIKIAFIDKGLTEPEANKVIAIVSSGSVPRMKILY